MLGLGLLLTLSAGFAQTTMQMMPAEQGITIDFVPVQDVGITGSARLVDYGMEQMVVVLALRGTQGGNVHPAHIHSGTCETGGPVVLPLESVDGTSGLSVTLAHADLHALAEGLEHHINIYASPEDMGTIIACGDLGMRHVPEGATGTTGGPGTNITAEPAPGTETDTGITEQGAQTTPPPGEAREQEFDTLRTASFGIFEVEGSGISGQVQIAETAEGGPRVVVTLPGIAPDAQYFADIRRGDCGTGGELVVQLNSVPIQPGENFGETRVEVSFEEVAEADNYLTIYASAEREDILACGEVGEGAIQ
jgi:hypothetical protein